MGPSKILKHGKLVEPEYSDDSDDVVSPTQADIDFIVHGVAANMGTQRDLAFQLAQKETYRTLPWTRAYSSSSRQPPPDPTRSPSPSAHDT